VSEEADGGWILLSGVETVASRGVDSRMAPVSSTQQRCRMTSGREEEEADF
jgi:hypothetical protein